MKSEIAKVKAAHPNLDHKVHIEALLDFPNICFCLLS
jgi:hypothetical protein